MLNHRWCVLPAFVLVALLGEWPSRLSRANEMLRPGALDEMSIIDTQPYLRVRTARIAWVDYAALRRDFPELGRVTDAEIDRWILDQFAYISQAQLGLQGIRTDNFSFDPDDSRDFSHPEEYERASVGEARVESRSVGLVDRKGSGNRDPARVARQIRDFQRILRSSAGERQAALLNKLRTEGHSDGLMSLGEGIAEVKRQQAIQRLFDLHNRAHGTSYQTVENYFLIDLGFDILKKDGEAPVRAAILGRQAHWRGATMLPVPPGTYVDTLGNHQSTLFDSSVDFGAVTITDPELKAKVFGEPRVSVDADGREFHAVQESPAWAVSHQTAARYEALVEQDPARARALIDEDIRKATEPLDARLAATRAPTLQQEYVSYLVHRLDARDPNARDGAARKLAELPPEDLFPLLDRLLSARVPDAAIVVAVSRLMAADKGRTFGRALAVKPGSMLDRRLAPGALEGLKGDESPEARAYVLRHLRSEDPVLAERAAAAFSSWSVPIQLEDLPKALEAPRAERVGASVVRALLSDETRIRAVPGAMDRVVHDVLQLKGKAAGPIQKSLLDFAVESRLRLPLAELLAAANRDDIAVASAAARALGDRDLDEIRPHLETLLASPLPSVRGNLVASLMANGRLEAGDPRRYELLERLLRANDRMAVLSLGPSLAYLRENPDPRAMDFILACLHQDSYDLSAPASAAFLGQGVEPILKGLRAALAPEKSRAVIARGLFADPRFAPGTPAFRELVAEAFSLPVGTSSAARAVLEPALLALAGDRDPSNQRLVLRAQGLSDPYLRRLANDALRSRGPTSSAGASEGTGVEACFERSIK